MKNQPAAELGNLHHIGIVVPTGREDAVVAALARLFAGTVEDAGEDEALDARWTWIRASSGSLLEVVSPLSDTATPLTRFLQRTGGGLHHVSFDAADIGACRATALDRGATVVGENGDHAGWAEFFVAPTVTGGALFHWMQAVSGE